MSISASFKLLSISVIVGTHLLVEELEICSALILGLGGFVLLLLLGGPGSLVLVPLIVLILTPALGVKVEVVLEGLLAVCAILISTVWVKDTMRKRRD